MSIVYIGISSNDDAEAHISRAIDQIKQQMSIRQISNFYWSSDIHHSKSTYLNGVIAVETHMFPGQLKNEVLRTLERLSGRKRVGAKVSIDLDLLPADRQGIADMAHQFYYLLPLGELLPLANEYLNDEMRQLLRLNESFSAQIKWQCGLT